jgi:glycosyltransferase involved in cell wall biosynthesis
MNKVRNLMREYNVQQNNMNIFYHGWVNKQTLSEAWLSSDIWFYPCTFMETFCLTALEAAASGTLAITSDLAALQETVGDRGILIPGDASTGSWHEKALVELFSVLKDPIRKARLVEMNKKWADSMSWKSRADEMLTKYIPEFPKQVELKLPKLKKV